MFLGEEGEEEEVVVNSLYFGEVHGDNGDEAGSMN